MVCCFLAQDTRCLCHFSLGRVSSSDLGVAGEGRQENGLSPCGVCPHPHMGTEGLSVTQPEASPGLGTVWPLSPGQGAIWGCPRATGARGRGRRASREAGLGGVGDGAGAQPSPERGAAGLGRQSTRQAFLPVPHAQVSLKSSQPTSCHFLLGTHQPAQNVQLVQEEWMAQEEGGAGPGGNRHLPREHCAPRRKGWSPGTVAQGTVAQGTVPPRRWPRGTQAHRGELTRSESPGVAGLGGERSRVVS